MKKTIKLSLIASLCVASISSADTNADLLAKITAMQKQIDKLIAAQTVPAKKSALQVDPVEYTQLKKDVATLKSDQEEINDENEERIDEIETATLTDKIKFGVEFRTRADNFSNTAANGDKYDANNVWSNRLRLNMKSQITDNMKFTGRLSMYKNWSDSYNYANGSADPLQGRRPSDSGLYVERAYIDWTVLQGEVPLTLTIGRQPSSDGPSHQFRDNSVRKSTYSALSFDGGTDGIVATIGLQKLTGIDSMALRLGYGKGYQADTGNSYVGNSAAIEDTDVFGIFLDTGLGIDGSLLQLSAVQANDVASTVPKNNKTIGDVRIYTAMLEFTNIADTNLDLFAHYSVSQSSPNGDYSLFNTSNPPGPTNPPLGLITSTPGDTEQKNGSAYWLGARYTLPFESMNNPRIGIEYNHGTENWFSFTQGSNDLTNKLATRGDATEVYYIQPINRYSYLRFGATMINYDYTNSGYQIGQPLSISDAATQNPTALKKLQNYYMLFNLAY